MEIWCQGGGSVAIGCPGGGRGDVHGYGKAALARAYDDCLTARHAMHEALRAGQRTQGHSLPLPPSSHTCPAFGPGIQNMDQSVFVEAAGPRRFCRSSRQRS